MSQQAGPRLPSLPLPSPQPNSSPSVVSYLYSTPLYTTRPPLSPPARSALPSFSSLLVARLLSVPGSHRPSRPGPLRDYVASVSSLVSSFPQIFLQTFTLPLFPHLSLSLSLRCALLQAMSCHVTAALQSRVSLCPVAVPFTDLKFTVEPAWFL